LAKGPERLKHPISVILVRKLMLVIIKERDKNEILLETRVNILRIYEKEMKFHWYSCRVIESRCEKNYCED
jgi:hypothetical protein